MVRLKELPKEELYAPGHRMCAGCGASIVARMVLKALDRPIIVVNATGCLEVATTIYPYTAWRVPWVHGLFENTAAIASGIEATLKALKRRGLGPPDAHIICFGGDGGTFDIGLQALSGALERGHRFTYVCYDNEAYMNTGIQRSSATPEGAATTTTPAGSVIPGKIGKKKDLIAIAVAHGIEYAATASPAYWNDLITKVKKAADVGGPAVIHILAPCPLGWGFETERTIEVARLAVQTRYFPLYEVAKGKYALSVKPMERPLEEFLKLQRRFKHLFQPEFEYELNALKEQVDANWKRLVWLCGS